MARLAGKWPTSKGDVGVVGWLVLWLGFFEGPSVALVAPSVLFWHTYKARAFFLLPLAIFSILVFRQKNLEGSLII